MTRIGATGHQRIPDSAQPAVLSGIREIIRAALPPLVAITSLAAGADQAVANEVLAVDGKLEVIVPCRRYERSFQSSAAAKEFRSLLSRADDVTRLDYEEPSEEAYWAAGRAVVDRSDLLLAVWDGQPARGLGGTADVVAYAREIGTPVRIVWPTGAVR